MFCGIGGFRLGLEKANTLTQPQNGKPQEGRNGTTRIGGIQLCSGLDPTFHCVWANDNDKYACQIYRSHFGDRELYEGDIRTVDVAAIPEHDLLCAGFPCQSFSIAGKRKGFEDTRGTLFFEICRVLRAKRPSYLFLENVKGLLSDDEGRTFQTILESLDELGYDCQWQVLNSKDFGVPQNRERVFIIGHLRGKPRPKVFPIGEGKQVGETSTWAYAIDSNIGKGCRGHRRRTMIYDIYNQQLRANQDLAGALKGEGIADTSLGTALIYHENISGKRTPHDEAQALRSGASHNYQTVNRIRRLTPLECECLQGFPDGWTEYGLDKNDNRVSISDTQRYKVLGNAVTVNVIEAIGR